MMAKRIHSARLQDRLPSVRGRYRADMPLAGMSWFRVGGAAEVLYEPADAEDLAAFLQQCDDDIPVTVLGVGSNCLIRDGGVEGVVVRLRQGFNAIQIAEATLTAGAGALDFTIARRAAAAGLAGLEFLIGVPGSIGGAVRMNAGAYGREIKDILIRAEALDRRGEKHHIAAEDLGLRYRHSDTPENWIFVSASFLGALGSPEVITAHMDRLAAERTRTQPILERTGGSTFKNPSGTKAWQLIDEAGCRGLRFGGAMVSEQHCNFLINTGTATARDIEMLGEEVRRRVHVETGIWLDWEIRRLGRQPQELQDVEGQNHG